MLASALAGYDRVLVWFGLRSRHASRATAATPRGYRARHYLPAIGERIEPQTDGSLVAPVAGLYTIGGKAMALLGCAPNMPDPRPPATNQPRPFGGWGYRAGSVPAAALGLPPAAACEPATDQPRPGSLPELGQRIVDSLMPWFDKAADTVTLPVWSGDMDFHNGVGDNLYFACNCDVSTPIDPNSVSLKVDWREVRTEQPMTQYGRADKL